MATVAARESFGQQGLPSMAHLLENQAYLRFDRRNTNIQAGIGGPAVNVAFVKNIEGDLQLVDGKGLAYFAQADPSLQTSSNLGVANTTDGVTFDFKGVAWMRRPGRWDQAWASYGEGWRADGKVYIAYDGSDGKGHGRVGLLTSQNGISNAVPFGQSDPYFSPKNSWEGEIGTPLLFKVNNRWRLFYHGFDGRAVRIGYASGSDLTSLARRRDPVLDVVPGSWESGTVGRRGIVFDPASAYYYMIYEGCTNVQRSKGDFEPASWSCGIARSRDLVSWARFSQNPVLPETGSGFGYDIPTVVRLNGVTWVYFRGPHPMGPRRARIATESSGGFEARWSALQLPHQIGRQEGDGWAAIAGRDPAGFLQFGPYFSNVPDGPCAAVWKFMVDNNTADNSPVVRLEVVNDLRVVASRIVTRKMWRRTMQYEYFSVPFDLSSQPRNVEFRVWWYGNSYIRLHMVGLA